MTNYGGRKFQILIASSNRAQFEHFKDSFYSPWKDLSNTISIVAIGVDLTYEIVKKIATCQLLSFTHIAGL
jgi:hypothetical protein